jgi:hypothetical protein
MVIVKLKPKLIGLYIEERNITSGSNMSRRGEIVLHLALAVWIGPAV